MMKLTRNKALLTVIAIIGFAFAFAGLPGYSIVAGVLASLALFRIFRCLEGERNWSAIQGALNDYAEIIDGQLWVGKDAEVLASDRVDDPKERGLVCFEHICRTKKGAWFMFHAAVTHGRLIDRSIRPCDEATAKYRLQRHKEVYVRCFGRPTNA